MKRPLPVLIVSCILIAAGAVGFTYHLTSLGASPFQYDLLGVLLVRLVAVVSGIYMLRGSNWARWLALAWITFHVAISLYHSWQQGAIHSLLLALIACLLFRPEARAYFQH